MSETAKRTVLITGSNRGIGKAMLLAAAQNGYDIIAHARKPNAEWKDTLLAASENYGVGIPALLIKRSTDKCALYSSENACFICSGLLRSKYIS